MYSAAASGAISTQMKAAPVDTVPDRGGKGVMGLHSLPQHQEMPVGSVFDQYNPRDDVSKGVLAIVNGVVRRAETLHDYEEGPEVHHAYIGLSLIAGFILMYLIDTVPQLMSGSSKPLHMSLNDLSNRSTPVLPSGQFGHPTEPSHAQTTKHSTTIGLVIHATADGIALGASTASPETRTTLGLVVFLAIMIHKAPAAFGLTAILLKQGLSSRMARAHLVVFSLAAPLGAIATWVLVNLLGTPNAAGGVGGHTWWTGVILIFSGGTFLYVAMHSMIEQSSVHGHGYSFDEADDNEMMMGGGSYESEGRSKDVLDVVLVVGGMLLPLLTQLGHSHAH